MYTNIRGRTLVVSSTYKFFKSFRQQKINVDVNDLVKYKEGLTNLVKEKHISNIIHNYKLQMDIYVHILRKMGFEVADIAYFYICNGEKNHDKFDSKINFSITIVPYTTKTSWIDKKICEMKSLLESDQIPEINKSCERCAYLGGGKKF